MTPVDLAPEVLTSLRAMADSGMPPQRCHKGVIIDGDRPGLLTGRVGRGLITSGIGRH